MMQAPSPWWCCPHKHPGSARRAVVNLRYGLSYRDVEELLAERGIAVDHVTVYQWVQRRAARSRARLPAGAR